VRTVPSGVGSGVGVGVTVKVGVGDGLGVAVGVGLNVGLGVAVGRGVFVGVSVEDGMGLAVAEAVGVGGSTSVVDVNTGLTADVDVNTRPPVGVAGAADDAALTPTDGTRSPDQNRSGDGKCRKPTCRTVNRRSSAATIQNRRISRKSIFIYCTTSPGP
jgi:hypothetical protein